MMECSFITVVMVWCGAGVGGGLHATVVRIIGRGWSGMQQNHFQWGENFISVNMRWGAFYPIKVIP